MKKKELDLFNILLGLIIGCVIGYFIFSQIKPTNANNNQTVTNEDIYGTVYTIQLGTNTNLELLKQIQDRLDVLGLYYEIYEEGGKYYIFNSVYSNLEDAQNKKQIIESYGFTVTIRSDYILDLPKNVITSSDNFDFYSEVIKNLINSLNNEQIIISDKYYSNPVDIELFSNITILMTIQNDDIKSNYELNTLCLLLKKLK